MSQRSTDQGGGIEMLKAPEWPLPAETLVKKLRNAPFRESHFLNTYFLNSRGGVFAAGKPEGQAALVRAFQGVVQGSPA